MMLFSKPLCFGVLAALSINCFASPQKEVHSFEARPAGVRLKAGARQSWEKASLPNLRKSSSQCRATEACPVPEGLIACWQGEENGDDTSGRFPGELSGGATYETGYVGSALSFDGKGSRFSIHDDAALALTGSMTIEGWLYILPLTGPGVIFARTDEREDYDPYAISLTPEGVLSFKICSGPLNWSLDAPGFIAGNWTHMAATLNDADGLMRVYKDGALVVETHTGVRPFRDLQKDQNPVVGIGNIGALPSSKYNFPFHGLVDEWSLYNRALSADEVKTIFDAGADGKDFPAK